MKRVILVLLVLLVVVLPLAAVAAARWYLTPDLLRAQAGDAALRATGRALTIAGPIRLTWALHPKIVAENVSFANPPGMSRPQMLHADRVEARLALWPLLSRRVEVTRVQVFGPDLRLQRDAAGHPNWLLEPPRAPPPSQQAAPPSPKPRMQVVIGRVEIQGGLLVWKGDGRTVSLELKRAAYAPGSGAFTVSTVLRGVPLDLAGTAGPFTAGPIPLQVKLAGAGIEAVVTGTSAQPSLALQAADLSAASVLAGVTLPPARDLRAQARLELTPAQVTLHELRASMRQGDVAGELTIALGARPSVRGTLQSGRVSLDDWQAPPSPAPSPPVPPPPPAPAPQTPGPRPVLPDAPLPLAPLRRADADVHLTVGEVLWRGISYRAVDTRLQSQDGRLRLDPVSVQGPGGALQGHLAADAAANPPTLAVTARAPGLAAAPLFRLLGAPEGTGGTVDLDVELTGQGETTRAVAATLDGHVGLAMVDGEIDNAWVATLFGDLLRKANLPFEPAGRSHVRCAAIRADFTQGQGKLGDFTLDTTRLKLDGAGAVDLAHETLDLHLRPQLRLGTALSVPLRISGSWRAPGIGLDAGALATGRVGIVVGGPPPTDTCGPALAAARGGQPGPAPAPPPAPEPERRVRPADLLRGLLR